MNKLIKYIVFVLLFLPGAAVSETYVAESCSQAHVQTAVTNASAYDTVIIPSGDCTGGSAWSGTITIAPEKPLIIQGAGEGITLIESSEAFAFALWSTADDITGARVTGISFIDTALKIDGENWRIDNCTFDFSASLGTLRIEGYRSDGEPKGLINNCTFDTCRVGIVGYQGLLFHYAFAQTLALGTDEAIYVEDCTFTNDTDTLMHAVDTNYGGSYVFRYNKVTDAYIEAHSLQSNSRGTKKWEIYNNTITDGGGTSVPNEPIRPRGGTGVIYNNLLVGWGSPVIALDNVRSHASVDTAGQCNGSSLWDGNQAIANDTVYGDGGNGNATSADATGVTLTDSGASWTVDALIGIRVYNVDDSDSFCTITDNTETTVVCSGGLSGGDNDDWEIGDAYKITDGYPCRDQIGRSLDNPEWVVDAAFTQSLDPSYEWNNCTVADCSAGDANDVDFAIHSASPGDAAWIVSGRDYVEDTEKPDYTPYGTFVNDRYYHPLRDDIPTGASQSGITDSGISHGNGG